jgi:hypothetical protein
VRCPRCGGGHPPEDRCDSRVMPIPPLGGRVSVGCITDPCDRRGPTRIELIYDDGRVVVFTALNDRLVVDEGDNKFF